MSLLGRGYELLAGLYPWSVTVGEDLETAVVFVDWPVDSQTVVRAGFGGAVAIVLLTLPLVALVSPRFRLALGLAGVSGALLVTHSLHALPRLAETARRTAALGAAPDLVVRLVLRMRLEPTPERAAMFGARTGEGVLAAQFATHVHRARGQGRSGLRTFGRAWADLFPALERSLGLIVAAGATPARDRERLLDRAMSVVLDGTRDQMQDFATGIRGPVTALYAFGVLLPTALVALLPAAGAAGVGVTTGVVVLVYGVVLPGVVLTASTWILARRPVAFPPPHVTAAHPDVRDRRRWVVVCGGLVALASWLVAGVVLPAWGPPVMALGLGGGVACWLQYRPILGVYRRIWDLESGLSDALELVGRRVAHGKSLEEAVAQAGSELDGEMGDVLEAAGRQQQCLQVDVETALLGEHGVLTSYPSPRVTECASLLSLAAKEGRPVGGALLSVAAHLEDLQDVEREARHELAHVCQTLQHTGAVFAPLIAGATVALSGGIGDGLLPNSEFAMPWLGAAVGWYVLVLGVILPTLATGLTRGLDRSLVGHRIGKTLVLATLTYLGSYLLVGQVA